MLGMMNCNNDAVEFYAAPVRGPTCESDKVFVEHKQRQKVSYTEDGRKMIDGKLVENLEQTKALTPQQRWNRLILVSAAAGGIKKNSGNDEKDVSRKASSSSTESQSSAGKQQSKSR